MLKVSELFFGSQFFYSAIEKRTRLSPRSSSYFFPDQVEVVSIFYDVCCRSSSMNPVLSV